jgi:hypothetical protein
VSLSVQGSLKPLSTPVSSPNLKIIAFFLIIPKYGCSSLLTFALLGKFLITRPKQELLFDFQ